MAEKQTEGLVQVLNNDVGSINRALADLVERTDQLKGLRGTASIAGDAEVNGSFTGKSQGAWKYEDKNGVVIHGWGNV